MTTAGEITPAGGEGAEPWRQFTSRQRWLFLLILFLVVTTSYADRFVLPLVLEPIKVEFGLTDTELGLLSGLPFTLCYALCTLPFGRLADRYSRKKVLLFSLILWSVMTGLCGLAQGLLMLFVARMGVGVGEGGAMPSSHALVASYFPAEQRGTAFVLLASSATAGTFIAFAIGGWLTDLYGWRGTFIAVAAFSIPVALLAAIVLVEPTRPEADDDRARHFRDDCAKLLGKRSYLLMIVGISFYGMFVHGPVMFIPTFLVREMGLGLAAAGAQYGTAVTIGTLVGTAIGALSVDRLQRHDLRWLLWLPAASAALVSLLTALAMSMREVGPFLLVVGIIYCILTIAVPALGVAAQRICGDRLRGTATSLYMIALTLIGATLGPILTGAISDALAPGFPTDHLRYALAIMALPLLAGALFWAAASRAIAADAVE
nr:MFS transporter [Sphingomonas sp. Y57]